jgi:hypothetical protein
VYHELVVIDQSQLRQDQRELHADCLLDQKLEKNN